MKPFSSKSLSWSFSSCNSNSWYPSPLNYGSLISIRIHTQYSCVHRACRAPIEMVNTRSHHLSMLSTCGLSSPNSYLNGSMTDRSGMIWVCPNWRSTRRGTYGWTHFKTISSMKCRSSPLTMPLGVDNQWSFQWILWISSSVRNICNPQILQARRNVPTFLAGYQSCCLDQDRYLPRQFACGNDR